MLNDGGVVLVNIISSIGGKSGRFLRAETATFKEVFPQVHVFAVFDKNDTAMVQSIALAGIKSTKPISFIDPDSVLQSYLNCNVTDKIRLDLPVLTDDRAPVDYYTNQAIK